jgi:DNA-binding IscR family transcriptional regulator
VASDYNYPLEKLAKLYSELSRPGLLNVINGKSI